MKKLSTICFLLIVSGCATEGNYHFDYDYGDTEYANFHGVYCRKDFEDICVESTVAINKETILDLISRMNSNSVVAVKVQKDYSNAEKMPVIAIVSGSYRWHNGKEIVPWQTNSQLQGFDATEEMSLFQLKGGVWKLVDTAQVIYDPF